METNSTPSLVNHKKLTNRRNLFELKSILSEENRSKRFVEQNECFDTSMASVGNETKDQTFDFYVENSLGLSPVRKHAINEDISYDLDESLFNYEIYKKTKPESQSSFGLVDIQANDSPFNRNTFVMNSNVMDESFRSLSKCSDLDLKANSNDVHNQTFRSPNCPFENKSIDSYFRQKSEPIERLEVFGVLHKSKSDSILERSSNDFSISSQNNMSIMSDSFISVDNDISASDNTLEIAQKIIDRKNRKRKAEKKHSFIPSINSTTNSCETNFKIEMIKNTPKSSSSSTSGLGTASTRGILTQSLPQSCSSSSLSSVGSALNLNQFLSLTPTEFSLTIGCFVTFNLNYLKVKNHSITSFKASFKLSANVETLNGFKITLPLESISIPALFEGLLTNDITITPIKCGTFDFNIEIYPSIDYVNLPINPVIIVFHIVSEPVLIRRSLSPTNSSHITYNLFESSDNCQTINLFIPNKYFSSDIPLKFSLEQNKSIIFEPLYRHPESVIHSFRCPDAHTLFTVTKTQYELKIPLRINSFSNRTVSSSLTVAIDSISNSHALAIYQIFANFWPKEILNEPSLQCPESSVTITRNKWKRINFRNKSKTNAIRVKLKCVRDKRLTQNFITFSSSDLIIPPAEKISIGLHIDQNSDADTRREYQLLTEHNSGLGKYFSVFIPIHIK